MWRPPLPHVVPCLVATAAAMLVVLSVVFYGPPHWLCTTDLQRSLLRRELVSRPTAGVTYFTRDFDASPAVVLDAWPQHDRVGVSADEFASVWERVRAWPEPVLMLDIDSKPSRFTDTCLSSALSLAATDLISTLMEVPCEVTCESNIGAE